MATHGRGCNGGNAEDGFDYAHLVNLTTESFYPYDSGGTASTSLCSPIIGYTSPGNVSLVLCE